METGGLFLRVKRDCNAELRSGGSIRSAASKGSVRFMILSDFTPPQHLHCSKQQVASANLPTNTNSTNKKEFPSFHYIFLYCVDAANSGIIIISASAEELLAAQ
ncbi:unnamed protein product [Ceratitis capitata]|uniref:(Mediterranean fruit fly) hypothetical protein n=1 Tax=Ceratitis capitata TaxID=7213 RepID=A0A811U7V1_CERCA|nr:unnamed protein product [Ceratitis capitata]